MQKYSKEMQYICKNNKASQEERIWVSKYKTTVIELQELKGRYKEMEKEKIDIERKHANKNKTKKTSSVKGNIWKSH